MGLAHSPKIVTDGLVLCLDAANKKSYPGSGNTWFDLSGNNNNFTISNTSTFTHNTNGYFDMTGGNISRNALVTNSTLCTCVFWIKTTDVQSLFWTQFGNGSYYLGAYRVGNKFYNALFGTPTYHQDTVQRENIYDYLIDGNWHMVEFKSVNLSALTYLAFSQYSTYIFESGSVSNIQIYNRNLTQSESTQNFNALKGRYGL